MIDPKHTPDSLAAKLDRVLANKARNNEDDPLVSTAVRLTNAPHPELSSQKVARLQAQVLDAHRHHPRSSRSRLPQWAWWLVASAAILVIAAFVLQRGGLLTPATVPDQTQSLPTYAPLTVPATNGIPPTLIPANPSPNAIIPETATSSSPASSPTALLTIEGPVASIENNLLTIAGIAVQLAPDDPLLPVIQVGDVLHVEGTPQTGENGLIVMATTVRVVNSDVFTNDSGQVWRDNGRCDNPPPTWAPAYGWHRRCPGNTGGDPGNGNGRGN